MKNKSQPVQHKTKSNRAFKIVSDFVPFVGCKAYTSGEVSRT